MMKNNGKGSSGRSATAPSMIPPGIDDVFEKFVADEIRRLSPKEPTAVTASARVAFYGAHYDRFFPDHLEVLDEEDEDIGSHRTLQCSMSAESMELGSDIYDRFKALYSERITPYRAT